MSEELYMNKVTNKFINYLKEIKASADKGILIDKREDTMQVIKDIYDVDYLALPNVHVNKFYENPSSKNLLELFILMDTTQKVDIIQNETFMRMEMLPKPEKRLTEKEQDILYNLIEDYEDDKNLNLLSIIDMLLNYKSIIVNGKTYNLFTIMDTTVNINDVHKVLLSLLCTSICTQELLFKFFRHFHK